MLKDKVRTLAYKRAIMQNRAIFRDKIVLDIGCGTGILSMFAAQAGAKLVIGVDMSDMIEHARRFVDANGLGDRIVLLKGRMEEVQLPVPTVDIIISEWMGYFCLYESMLDTVLWARDRYLIPFEQGGRILPDEATLQLAVIEDAEYRAQKIDFWHDVYGFDMSSIIPEVLREPLVDTVEEKALVSRISALKTIDIMHVTKADLDFVSNFEMEATADETVHAFLGYFDISFRHLPEPVHFSTGPQARYTHWKQAVFYVEKPFSVRRDQTVRGTISVCKHVTNHRELNIAITHCVEPAAGAAPTSSSVPAPVTNHFHMR